jgi:hypothetical protein
MFVSDVFKGDTVQGNDKAFEVNGNEIADKPDAIRYARAIAEESGKPVMVWQSGLPVLWIAPEIKIGRVTV